jgi:tetratricopeptide (TPR) repeat protein
LIEIEKRRPTWSHAALLTALLDDLNNEPGKALESYLRAFEQGHHQLAFARGVVQRLIESGRILEADEVVRKLQQQVLLHGDFARQGAEIALRTRQFDRAADLARQAVPADLRDWRSEMWLGQMLAACGQADEAESVLRQAVALADDLPDTWTALIAHLNNQNRAAATEAEITAMKEKIAPDRLEVALGDCYQALGRLDVAEKHYQTARRQQPRDDQAMQRLASYYLRLLQPAKAEPALRDLLDPANPVPPASVAWARRQLALILAMANDADRHGEALALLERNRRGGVLTRVDQRILDLVRATDKASRAVALHAIEDSGAANPPVAGEDLFVARLYALVEDWPHERDHLTAAIGLDPKNPEYIALCIRRLIDHDQNDEARSWLNKLEILESGSERVKKLQAEVVPPRDAR